MNPTLPEGIPQQPLSKADEMALAKRIQLLHDEDDTVKLAMHGLCEAIPYLCTVSKGNVPQDELLSMSYDGLLHAAKNYRPRRLRFFCYAKVYLRNRLSKWWRSQDIVKDASMFEDKELNVGPQHWHPVRKTNPEFDVIDLRERWELVKPMLAKLTERERLVLELLHVGGFSLSKVARMLVPSISREAVRLCNLRALRKLHFAIGKIKRTLEI